MAGGDSRQPVPAHGSGLLLGDAIVGSCYAALADVRASSGDSAAADEIRQEAIAYLKLTRKRLEDALREDDAPYSDY